MSLCIMIMISTLCTPYPASSDGKPSCKGRFAPSPSGRMHLGNVYAALFSYISAKAKGGRWLLRIEDIDRQRSRREWADLIMSDLDWLGLGWDEGPVYQSERDDVYQWQLERLEAMGLLYPCSCTRAELLATRAPHASDGHVAYGGRCRPSFPIYNNVVSEESTLRLMVPPYVEGISRPGGGDVEFADRICGVQRVSLYDYCGDFIVRRRDGAWAYQFAVSVDDSLMGATEIVRGDDLLLSTAPQRYVADMLGLTFPHTYAHLPLLTNESGVRLSKRDGALSMEWLRGHSTPRDIVVKICRASGVDVEEAFTVLERLGWNGGR